MTAVETYDDGVPPRRGVSLAKGPVAIIGALSLALGILGFIFASQSFTMDPPSGTVNGSNFIGIEVYRFIGASNVPLAAAFATIPMLIMGVYLLIARRIGAFEAL